MRGSNFFIGLGLIPVFIWWKKNIYDPKYTAPKLLAKKKELEGEKKKNIFQLQKKKQIDKKLN